MLEGLEISILRLSELERTLRFDSEFYKKENLETLSKLKQKGYGLLTEYVKVTDGNHMSISENFIAEGVPYYRGQDVHDFFIEQSSPICIDEQTFFKPVMKRSHLQKGDLLLSIVGTIGKLSLVYSNRHQTCSCKLAILRPNISAEFLAILLTTKYGQNQIQRLTRGAVQMGLILEDMNQILIPVLSKVFQKSIERIVLNAYSCLENSRNNYKQAEQLILQELGINETNWQTKGITTNNKSFKESFADTGRLDAEYYQPKYDDYSERITKYKSGWLKLNEACILYDSNINPSESVTYKYIELSNIGGSGEVNGCIQDTGLSLPSRARRLVKSGQLIVSSIEGSLQSCAIITEEYNNALCSTGFYVVSSKLINSESLLVLFKSEILQSLMKKGCSGTILTAISKEEFSKLPFPLLDMPTQQQIASLIQQSFQLRKQSKHLLDIAKQAVEMAIETDETIAMAFIKAKAE